MTSPLSHSVSDLNSITMSKSARPCACGGVWSDIIFVACDMDLHELGEIDNLNEYIGPGSLASSPWCKVRTVAARTRGAGLVPPLRTDSCFVVRAAFAANASVPQEVRDAMVADVHFEVRQAVWSASEPFSVARLALREEFDA